MAYNDIPIIIIETIMIQRMTTAPTILKLVTKLSDDELPVARITVGSIKKKCL